MHQTGSPEALLASIAQSGGEAAQGWMRLLTSAAADPGWLADLQRHSTRFGAAQSAYYRLKDRIKGR